MTPRPDRSGRTQTNRKISDGSLLITQNPRYPTVPTRRVDEDEILQPGDPRRGGEVVADLTSVRPRDTDLGTGDVVHEVGDRLDVLDTGETRPESLGRRRRHLPRRFRTTPVDRHRADPIAAVTSPHRAVLTLETVDDPTTLRQVLPPGPARVRSLRTRAALRAGSGTSRAAETSGSRARPRAASFPVASTAERGELGRLRESASSPSETR